MRVRPSVITQALTTEKRRIRVRQGDVMVEAEARTVQPQAKEQGQLLGDGRGEE